MFLSTSFPRTQGKPMYLCHAKNHQKSGLFLHKTKYFQAMFLNNSRQQPNHGRTRRADWGCWQGRVGLCRFSGHLKFGLFFNRFATYRDEMFDVLSTPTDECNLYGVELNLDRDRAQCNNHQLFVIVSPIMSPQLLLIVANFQPNYFLDKLGPTSQVINPKVHPSLW